MCCVCCVCCVFKIFGGCLQDFWAFPLPGNTNLHVWALGLSCETPAVIFVNQHMRLEVCQVQFLRAPKNTPAQNFFALWGCPRLCVARLAGPFPTWAQSRSTGPGRNKTKCQSNTGPLSRTCVSSGVVCVFLFSGRRPQANDVEPENVVQPQSRGLDFWVVSVRGAGFRGLDGSGGGSLPSSSSSPKLTWNFCFCCFFPLDFGRRVAGALVFFCRPCPHVFLFLRSPVFFLFFFLFFFVFCATSPASLRPVLV